MLKKEEKSLFYTRAYSSGHSGTEQKSAFRHAVRGPRRVDRAWPPHAGVHCTERQRRAAGCAIRSRVELRKGFTFRGVTPSLSSLPPPCFQQRCSSRSPPQRASRDCRGSALFLLWKNRRRNKMSWAGSGETEWRLGDGSDTSEDMKLRNVP